MLCWVSLQSGHYQERSFPNTYTTFRLLPKYWVADWLVRLGIGRALADKLDARAGLRNALTFLTGLAPTTYWPPSAHDKEALSAFLQAMFVRMGNRHTNLKKHIASDGSVDWCLAGPYSFTWGKEGETEVVTEIKHLCGEKVDGAWGRLDTILSCFSRTLPWCRSSGDWLSFYLARLGFAAPTAHFQVTPTAQLSVMLGVSPISFVSLIGHFLVSRGLQPPSPPPPPLERIGLWSDFRTSSGWRVRQFVLLPLGLRLSVWCAALLSWTAHPFYFEGMVGAPWLSHGPTG